MSLRRLHSIMKRRLGVRKIDAGFTLVEVLLVVE